MNNFNDKGNQSSEELKVYIGCWNKFKLIIIMSDIFSQEFQTMVYCCLRDSISFPTIQRSKRKIPIQMYNYTTLKMKCLLSLLNKYTSYSWGGVSVI